MPLLFQHFWVLSIVVTVVSGVACGLVAWNGNCLNLGSNTHGLYLSTMFPFRLAHPALLIPWSDIQHHDTKRMFFFDVTEFRFTKHPTITLQLKRSLAHDLLTRAPSTIGPWRA